MISLRLPQPSSRLWQAKLPKHAQPVDSGCIQNQETAQKVAKEFTHKDFVRHVLYSELLPQIEYFKLDKEQNRVVLVEELENAISRWKNHKSSAFIFHFRETKPPRSWGQRGPKIARNHALLLAQVPTEAFNVLIQRRFKDT